jgi:hypothetical protein
LSGPVGDLADEAASRLGYPANDLDGCAFAFIGRGIAENGAPADRGAWQELASGREWLQSVFE